MQITLRRVARVHNTIAVAITMEKYVGRIEFGERSV